MSLFSGAPQSSNNSKKMKFKAHTEWRGSVNSNCSRPVISNKMLRMRAEERAAGEPDGGVELEFASAPNSNSTTASGPSSAGACALSSQHQSGWDTLALQIENIPPTSLDIQNLGGSNLNGSGGGNKAKSNLVNGVGPRTPSSNVNLTQQPQMPIANSNLYSAMNANSGDRNPTLGGGKVQGKCSVWSISIWIIPVRIITNCIWY